MEELFLKCLNLSIRASYMILAVLVIRLLFAKAERKYMVWLWIMVGIRLICPVSFTSLPTILPHTEVIPEDIALSQSPAIESGFAAEDQSVNHYLQQNFSPAIENSVNPMQVLTSFCAAAWLCGIAVMLGYMAVSSFLLDRRIRHAGRVKNGIIQSRHFETPFVFGLFRPIICLPECEGEKKELIIHHERMHIRRKDHVLKYVAFLILSVYWFHPLVWLAYHLLCRDIEMACDEAVIRHMKRNERGDYAKTLLEFAVSGSGAAGPVAFGETDVKRRIRSILKYRKPSVGSAVCLMIAALIICTGCFADQPDAGQPEETPSADQNQEAGKETETTEAAGVPEESEEPETTPQETVLSVESLLANPSAYINTHVRVQGNLPQSAAGFDDKGNPIAYLNGVSDLSQGIRIVDFIPSDGSCLVEAYGTVVYLDNGELALSMEGYTILSQAQTGALTVESLLADPSAYVNTYVTVQGNLPQSISGFDDKGNPIACLNGVSDLSQGIRIVDFIPTDGSCLVEAYGTVVYLDNGELALSMEGYTILH